MPLKKIDSFKILTGPSFLVFPKKEKETFFNKKLYLCEILKKNGKVFALEPFQKKIFSLPLSSWLIYKKKLTPNFYKEKLQFPNRFNVVHFILAPHCNMKCGYCLDLSWKRKQRKLSFFRLKKIVDFMAEHNPYCGVSFVGSGEPTLNLPVLKKGITYIRKKLKPKRLEISTNGVQIKKKDLFWLADNVHVLQISLDGPPPLQNKMRPLKGGRKSSLFVETTVKFLKKGKKNFKISTVISPLSVGKEKEILSYFLKLGIKNLSFKPLYDFGGGKRLLNGKNRLILESLYKLKEEADFLKFNNTITSESIFENKSLFSCGVGNALVITPDKNIFACSLLAGQEDFKFYENARKLVIGKYDAKNKKYIIDNSAVEKLRTLHVKVAKCKRCNYKLCYGGCFLKNKFKKNKITPAKENCLKEKLSFKYLGKYLLDKSVFQLFPRFEKINSEIFFKFLFSSFNISKKELLFLKINLHQSAKEFRLLKKDIETWSKNKKIFPLVLISSFQKKQLNKKESLCLEKFLLDISKIPLSFRLTKPIVFSPNAFYFEKKFLRKYLMPFSCYQCLEIFRVEEKKICFCNGEKGKEISKIEDRLQIYNNFKKVSLSHPPSCFAFYHNIS